MKRATIVDSSSSPPMRIVFEELGSSSASRHTRSALQRTRAVITPTAVIPTAGALFARRFYGDTVETMAR